MVVLPAAQMLSPGPFRSRSHGLEHRGAWLLGCARGGAAVMWLGDLDSWAKQCDQTCCGSAAAWCVLPLPAHSMTGCTRQPLMGSARGGLQQTHAAVCTHVRLTGGSRGEAACMGLFSMDCYGRLKCLA